MHKVINPRSRTGTKLLTNLRVSSRAQTREKMNAQVRQAMQDINEIHTWFERIGRRETAKNGR